jgi:hypothetical protein
MNAGFDGMQKLVIRFMSIMIAALIGTMASLVGVVATALL